MIILQMAFKNLVQMISYFSTSNNKKLSKQRSIFRQKIKELVVSFPSEFLIFFEVYLNYFEFYNDQLLIRLLLI